MELDTYRDMVPIDMQVALVQRDRVFEEYSRELMSVSRSRDYYAERVSELRQQLEDQQNHSRDLVAKINMRPGLRCISKWGGYHIALSRNVGNASGEGAVAMVAGLDAAWGFFFKESLLGL